LPCRSKQSDKKKYWPIKPFGKDIKFGLLLFLEKFLKKSCFKTFNIYTSNQSSCSVSSNKKDDGFKQLKLRNCEKAIRFLKTSQLFWCLLSGVKTRGRFNQLSMEGSRDLLELSVAFSKNLNLNKVWFIYLYHFKIDTKGFVSFITQSFKCGLPKGVLTWITCCGLQNIEALTASNVWLRRYVWQMSCYIPNQCNFRSRTLSPGLQNSIFFLDGRNKF
jgi:hypothetical protein